jgi:hypothetical protein
MRRVAILACLVWAALPAVAAAQVQAPRIGLFAVDVRGVLARFGPTEEQATAIGYAKTDLPTKGWGLDLGAHVYPVRWRRVALGVGGNLMTSSGHAAPVNAKGKPTGRETDTRLKAMGTQLSLNFGSQEGWSYLSGGVGYATFTLENAAYPAPESPEKRLTINYGFGARWTVRGHVGFAIDFRFYRLSAGDPEISTPTQPGTTRFTLGAGLTFK